MATFAGSNMTLLRGLAAPSRASSSYSYSWWRRVDCRHISQVKSDANRGRFLVDTLALVKRLESQGVAVNQAEVITTTITQVLNNTVQTVTNSFVSKPEMQKIELTQESGLNKFKSEVQISQGNHFSLLQHETEKLKSDMEKMRSELRYEVDKVTAGQRLDLNLERGQIRDELAKQRQENSSLTNKLDREIHALRAQMEAAKYDVIKYCLGTLVSLSAVSLAFIRTLM